MSISCSLKGGDSEVGAARALESKRQTTADGGEYKRNARVLNLFALQLWQMHGSFLFTALLIIHQSPIFNVELRRRVSVVAGIASPAAAAAAAAEQNNFRTLKSRNFFRGVITAFQFTKRRHARLSYTALRSKSWQPWFE